MKPLQVHRATDPWAPHVEVSRQTVLDFYECLPHQLLNGARIHVRKADRCYAQATHQGKAEKKVKWHGRALWHLCQGAFIQLVAEFLFESGDKGDLVTPANMTHNQLELCWAEAMRRASMAAQAGAQAQGGRN